MKIASFLLPMNHPRGDVRYAEAHQYAKARLLDRFGGYTASEVNGAWRDDYGRVHHDASIRYEVAHDWQANDVKEFIAIAREAGRMQPQSQNNGQPSPGQNCVFVVDPWGGEAKCWPCDIQVVAGYAHNRL